MSPIHFQFIEEAFNISGHKLVILPKNDKESVEEGLRYVNNDACYPAIIVVGQIIGEGWLLTGEMIELIEGGVNNIICMQPFACLPNHITGKGVIKEIKRLYKEANIMPIDYDPGASEVNQLNRIKLMLSTAFTNINN